MFVLTFGSSHHTMDITRHNKEKPWYKKSVSWKIWIIISHFSDQWCSRWSLELGLLRTSYCYWVFLHAELGSRCPQRVSSSYSWKFGPTKNKCVSENLAMKGHGWSEEKHLENSGWEKTFLKRLRDIFSGLAKQVENVIIFHSSGILPCAQKVFLCLTLLIITLQISFLKTLINTP